MNKSYGTLCPIPQERGDNHSVCKCTQRSFQNQNQSGVQSHQAPTDLFHGLPLEKVARNIIRARFLRSGPRPYRTENIYAPFTLGGAAKKEDAIAKHKHAKKKARKG